MLTSNEKIKFRIKIIAICLILPIAVLVAFRLYHVQITMHHELFLEAKKKYTATRKTTSKRGEIFTNDGYLLVGNNPCVNLIADPSILAATPNQREQLSFLLAKYLTLDYKTVYNKLAPTRTVRDKDGKPERDENGNEKVRKVQYAMLAREVPLERANLLKQKVEINRIKGVKFENTYQRHHPKGRMLANILGFTSVDGDLDKAVSGIEKTVNQYISGESGKTTLEISRDGRPLSYGLYEESNVKDGQNIYLTVNEVIQSIMEEELDKAFAAVRPKAIYAVMLDPATGNIMAIAQRPTFDPNNRKTINAETTRPRIFADVMEPGSIIKPFTVAVAIDRGVVTPNTLIDCEKGYWIYKGKPLTDSHSIPIVTVAEMLRQSSNIGTAKVALMLTPEIVYDNLYKFGFGQRTGIPLRPESRGVLAKVANWDGLTVTRIPIGYSLNVTPLQMVRAYGALANNGNLHKLRLIDRIEDPETGQVTVTPIEPPVQMFNNPRTAATMVQMLAEVTTEGGTATKAAIRGYSVAGKTGTSRKYVAGQGYLRKYFASFVGFVPASSPAFVLLVTVDEPTVGSYYGGSVSGPVFRAIATRTLKHLNIHPESETATTP